MKRAILYLTSLPWDLVVAWPIVLGIRALWGTDLRWERGSLCCELKPGSYPIGGPVDPRDGMILKPRIWPCGWYLVNRSAAIGQRERPVVWGATSLGHAIFASPGCLPPRGTLNGLLVHELHHTVQAETANVQAFVLALCVAFGGNYALAFGIWALGGYLATASAGWVTAWLRGDPRGMYRGSAHEIGAYAVEADWERHRHDLDPVSQL